MNHGSTQRSQKPYNQPHEGSQIVIVHVSTLRLNIRQNILWTDETKTESFVKVKNVAAHWHQRRRGIVVRAALLPQGSGRLAAIDWIRNSQVEDILKEKPTLAVQGDRTGEQHQRIDSYRFNRICLNRGKFSFCSGPVRESWPWPEGRAVWRVNAYTLCETHILKNTKTSPFLCSFSLTQLCSLLGLDQNVPRFWHQLRQKSK